MHWIANDYVSKQLTVIAWRFVDEPSKFTRCWALGEVTMRDMLTAFMDFYDAADIVMGHYVRGHDLPLLNGALLENGYEPLSDKLTIDTKGDLVNFAGLSKSQKNLSATLQVHAEKLDMDQEMWRQANQLEPQGIAWVKERCISDVNQNIELYEAIQGQGFLRPPRWWTSRGTARARYTP